MRHLLVAIATALVLFALTLAQEPPEDDDIVKELYQDSVILQEQETSDLKVSAKKYVTCEGTTWSCENCNTRKLCLEFFWYTGITYSQCPMWAPYCDPTSSLALCTSQAPTGCAGSTNSTG